MLQSNSVAKRFAVYLPPLRTVVEIFLKIFGVRHDGPASREIDKGEHFDPDLCFRVFPWRAMAS